MNQQFARRNIVLGTKTRPSDHERGHKYTVNNDVAKSTARKNPDKR